MASLPTDYLNESTNLQVADTEVNIQVLKADGRVVPFHAKKIYKAIKKAERFLSEQNEAAADYDVDAVVALVVDKLIASEAESVSTDDIHDQVEAKVTLCGGPNQLLLKKFWMSMYLIQMMQLHLMQLVSSLLMKWLNFNVALLKVISKLKISLVQKLMKQTKLSQLQLILVFQILSRVK